ncbi:MAG: cellulose biosynthesis cyclic di-GMP-binding regulatory protein BcsB [Chloroflexota bacterium]
MKNKLFSILIVPIIILSLFSGLVNTAYAQGITNPNEISLLEINNGEIQLTGPYDSTSTSFGLPASWNLSSGASMTLNLAVSFSSTGAQDQTAPANVTQGGTLTVRFNGSSVGVLTLNQNGESTQTFKIPPSALISQRADGRMDLGFILDSGISCFVNQQMIVIIRTTSVISLPHDEITPDTSLVNFPRQLNTDSVFNDTSIVVIPDQPTSAELQAAYTIAAVLGSMAGTTLAIDMTTVSQLTAEQKAGNQMIVVGKSTSLPIIRDLKLSLGADNGQFALTGEAADNGIIQLVTSPWSTGKVVLLVSGNSDAGVVKAAQAVSTGTLRPNAYPNLSIVEVVQSEQIRAASPVDQSLNDLAVASNKAIAAPGKAIKTLRFGSTSSSSYQFFVPAGQTVSQDAYFDLVFGHSTLLNYARSGLAILVNGQPIGTVRMSDTTAAKSTNHVQFNIPAAVIVPGYNRLEIRANLIPNDACTNPQFDGLWATIWPDSMLHAPLVPNQISINSAMDLSAYPAPFVLQPTLSSTAIVVPNNDLDAWRSGLRIVNFLGNRTKGGLFNLTTFFADELKDPDRAKYNLLLVGRPSQLPIVSEFNANLPAPFDASSDIAKETNMQVKFSIPDNTPAGYVELVASPWNADNLIIAAFGNSAQGVSWAASALVDAPLRSLLAGNFAVINGAQVLTADTRLTNFSTGTDVVQSISAPDVSPVIDLASPQANKASWMLPAIYGSVALLLIVVMVALFGAWIRGRNNTGK